MTTSPTLALCMAGRYRRFANAGYTTPKFLLTVQGRTILEAIAGELAEGPVLLVANQADRPHETAIVDAMRRAGVEPILHWTPDTSGQAETAAIAARAALDAGLDGPLVLHNVDTILYGRSLGRIGATLGRVDGFIDVFPNDSAAYSYVELVPEDGLHRVVRIAEKVVISAHATTGLYGFRSPQAYLDFAERTTHRSGGEFYVSDVYRTMLEHDAFVAAEPPTPGSRTVVLGTPSEYEAWIATHGV